MSEDSKTHFEKMVEHLIKDRGPLTSRDIAYALAEDEMLMVINSPSEVIHAEDDKVVINTIEQNLRSVSVSSVQKRLERAWFIHQDGSGRWHLGSQ